MSNFIYHPPVQPSPDARTKCIDCQASIPAKYTRCWNCWGKQPSEKIKSMYKPVVPVVSEEELTDMFGEGGKEEVKEAYKSELVSEVKHE